MRSTKHPFLRRIFIGNRKIIRFPYEKWQIVYVTQKSQGILQGIATAGRLEIDCEAYDGEGEDETLKEGGKVE